MKAVFASVPEWLLEQRRDIGIDHLDETWNGELHLVAMPEPIADYVTTELASALTYLLNGKLAVRTRARIGSERDYRVPDITVMRDEAPVVVVEMLGEHEEAREKLPFYASQGVAEIWLVDPAARTVELHRAIDGGTVVVAGTRSPTLGVDVVTVEGRLRLTSGDVVADV
jgi:Uma2 family endonuclease